MLMTEREMREQEMVPECGAILEEKDQENNGKNGADHEIYQHLTLNQTFGYYPRYAFKASSIQLTPNTVFVFHCKTRFALPQLIKTH